MRRSVRSMRALALALFGVTALMGSLYYWVKLSEVAIRPERRIMWQNAAAWWQGMQGNMLTHHRPGAQLAHLDPATGRLLAVWDLRGDAEALAEGMSRAPSGRWVVVTLLEPGYTDAELARLERLFRDAGWTGDIGPANGGAGVFLLTAGRNGGGLRAVAGQVSGRPEVRLELPSGLPGADGALLRDRFVIQVRPYD